MILRILSATFLAILLASGLTHVSDNLTWAMEVGPAVIGFVILLTTHRRFPLTTFLYAALWVHALILIIGGQYTYAEVPLFNWLRDTYHLSRNHYDRVGHFAQGFFPALLTREILLRTTALKRGKMLFFLVVCVCLAISACYEFIEWWTALILKQGADAFLGTQGDVWDTQWDMFMATVGAITALLTLSGVHDRQLKSLAAKSR